MLAYAAARSCSRTSIRKTATSQEQLNRAHNGVKLDVCLEHAKAHVGPTIAVLFCFGMPLTVLFAWVGCCFKTLTIRYVLFFHARVPIQQSTDWQTLRVKLNQLRGDRGEQTLPKTWQTLCQLGIKGRHGIQAEGKATTTIGAGLFDKDRKLRNLRWGGGSYPRGILMPGGDAELNATEYAAQFQSQINHSITLEKTVDKR